MRRNPLFCTILLTIALLFAWQAESRAVDHIDATFEGSKIFTHYTPAADFVPGQPVPVAPNRTDRPCHLSTAAGFTVENSHTMDGPTLNSNFLRLVDTDTAAGHGADFDFYDLTWASGCVRVSWDVLFESRDNYYFSFRNGRGDDPEYPTRNSIADIYARPDGSLVFIGGGSQVLSTTYETGKTMHCECFFDLNRHRWAVVVNGEVLFNNAVIPTAPLGLFIPGYGNDPDVAGAMQVDNIEMLPRDGCEWPQMNAACPRFLPSPRLLLTGTENAIVSGSHLVRLRLTATNWRAYPDRLFAPSPDLPPCGRNTNSSRTWIEIRDQDNNYLQGFCGFITPQDLNSLWFGVKTDGISGIQVIMNDRLCNWKYRSALIPFTTDMLATIRLEVNGPGEIVTSDLFRCRHDQLNGNEVCTLTYLKGQEVEFWPYPRDGAGYRASFVGWSGACTSTGPCSLVVTGDATLSARFGAVDSAPATLGTLPLPPGPTSFTSGPAVTPVYDQDPAACRPFAAGNLGEGNLDLKLGLPRFAGAVDVYLGLYLPAVNPDELYLLAPAAPAGYHLVPYSTSGLVPWKSSTRDPGTQNFFGPIPLAALPAGTYYLYTLVTPARDTQLHRYYLWTSAFTVR